MNSTVDPGSLRKKLLIRFLMLYVLLGMLFFLPAGTFSYWEGWAYMAVISLPMMAFTVTMFRKNPEFLERRMRVREKRAQQRWIQRATTLPILFAFLLPGFDRRFGWSDVPLPLVLAAIGLVLVAYLLVLWVFRTNAYASRLVEVDEEQKPVTTGPYAAVRHPMYSGIIVFYMLTPIALGSYWGVIPALLIIPVLIVRILDEEKALSGQLAGYREYIQQVRFRLIPGIW